MSILSRSLLFVAAILMSLALPACAGTAPDSNASGSEVVQTRVLAGTDQEIPALEGSVTVPDGYVLQDESTIVPADDPAGESFKITIKVNDKLYDDVNYAQIKRGEAELYALNAVLGFSASDYDIVEDGGQRFFCFASRQDGANVFTYATILDGHMVYVSANTGDAEISDAQRAALESIAFSIRSEL